MRHQTVQIICNSCIDAQAGISVTAIYPLNENIINDHKQKLQIKLI